jgi:hypothetical protein
VTARCYLQAPEEASRRAEFDRVNSEAVRGLIG